VILTIDICRSLPSPHRRRRCYENEVGARIRRVQGLLAPPSKHLWYLFASDREAELTPTSGKGTEARRAWRIDVHRDGVRKPPTPGRTVLRKRYWSWGVSRLGYGVAGPPPTDRSKVNSNSGYHICDR